MREQASNPQPATSATPEPLALPGALAIAPAPGAVRPRVIIVGAGFGGLRVARELQDEPVKVVLIDRRNHHLFQPLLYQVATGALSSSNIATPIRRLFRRHPNVQVLLWEVRGVDPGRRVVQVDGGELAYDFLVLAPGVRPSYFGHPWEASAPGLGSIEDALDIRARFLLAFEVAEREADAAVRAAALTFVVVGGGPTGVELAGAMAEVARRGIAGDFRAVDTRHARVVLVESLDRVLSAFPASLSARAQRDLEALGVEVRLDTRVTQVDDSGVTLERGGETSRLPARNVVWAAGVTASPLGRMVTDQVDGAGRVQVLADLSVPGHPEVFCLGDAAVMKATDGRVLPGVAQGALQGGRHVGRLLRQELQARRQGRTPPPRPAFRYHDKGILATIGRNRAIADAYGLKVVGWPAWLLWAMVHIAFLIGFRNKLFTMLEWAWMYLFPSRGSRLITQARPPARPDPAGGTAPRYQGVAGRTLQ